MNIAFIPVRGGSKSIPLKNIKPICGKPLVYWTVAAACGCASIDKIYVATDSDVIRDTVQGFGFEKVEVVGRSAASASDTASTEFAMLEFAEAHEFDNIALVQATSPLLTSDDLERGFAAFSEDGCDSVISVVPQKRFYWAYQTKGETETTYTASSDTGDAAASCTPDETSLCAHTETDTAMCIRLVSPTNYDVYNRPRRQDFDGCLTENGAFYITSRADLLRTKNRVSGRITAVEMCEDSFFEIDEPSDWIIIEALMRKHGLGDASHPDTTPSVATTAYTIEAAAKSNIYFDGSATSAHTIKSIPAPNTCASANRHMLPDLSHIRMFLTDSDGCLTDGGMYYTENGDEIKKFCAHDGKGISLLREHGIITGIVTGEKRQLVAHRAEKLKMDIIRMGNTDKLSVIRELSEEYGIPLSDICYVGDDIFDIPAIRAVGFGCSVANAIPSVKEAADYVTTLPGGSGAIREITDLILGYNTP